MNRWIKMCYPTLSMILLAVLVAGCSGGGGNATDPSRAGASAGDDADGVKRLVFARSEDVLKLDKYNSTLLSDGMMIAQMNEPLLWQTHDGKLKPWLATRWEVNADATEWTFWLRDDVTFSDGTPMTAADVKATYEYPRDNNVALSKTWKDLKEVEIVDDYQVKVIFNVPCGAMSYMAYLSNIYSKEIIAKGPDAMATESLGTGPWKLKEWNPGDNMILERNEHYWGEKPYFDELEYKVIIEDSTRLAAVQTGAVDIAEGVAPELYEQVEQDPGVQLYKTNLADQQWLGLKCDKAPFDNIKAREALSLCLDRQVFVDILGGKVSTSIIPSKSLGGNADWPALEFDPGKARQLLSESGYDGEKIVLLSFTGSYPKTMEQLETVQAMMTAVGFNVSLEVFEMSTFLERRASEQYHLFWTGCAMSGLDPDVFLTSRIVNNTQKCNYVNEALNAAIKNGQQATTLEGRQAAYDEATSIVNREFAPFIPIYETVSAYAVSPNIDLSNAEEVFRPDRKLNFIYIREK